MEQFKQISAVSMLALLKEVVGKKIQVFQSWRNFLKNLRTTIDEQDESSLKNLHKIIGKSELSLKNSWHSELPHATNCCSKICGVEGIIKNIYIFYLGKLVCLFFFAFSLMKRDNCIILHKQTDALTKGLNLPM